ncbi:MAG: DUF4333 domain-containing protein [Thermoleophilia bacterium]|nr:DUF4333 domain-containing protein [Thermoleophilia bacterium]
MQSEYRYGFHRLITCFLALALLAGVLGGCKSKVSVSTRDRLDTDKAEREISKSASKQVGEKVKVNCPNDVKVELGLETICQATDAHERTQRLRMRQTDTLGHTSWTLIRDLDTLKLEPGIIRIGATKGLKINDVSCPIDVEIVAGTRFTCKVSINGTTASLPALETDDQGNIELDWNALKKYTTAA